MAGIMATSVDSQVQKREKRGRAYPNPPPKHPISERLEHVRVHFGFRSKRAFWQRVCDGWDGYRLGGGEKSPISYEAVRNYHYDREPRPSYLARVAELCGVRLEWLITGKGGMFAFPQAPGLGEGEVCPAIRGASPGIQARFADLAHLYWLQAPDHAPRHSDQAVAEVKELTADLDALLTLPLRWWGFVHPEHLAWSERDHYLAQMIEALLLVVQGARLGNPLAIRPTGLMEAVTEAMAEAEREGPLPSGESESWTALVDALREDLNSDTTEPANDE